MSEFEYLWSYYFTKRVNGFNKQFIILNIMKKSDFKNFVLKAESCFWLLKSESQRLFVSLRKEVDRTMGVDRTMEMSKTSICGIVRFGSCCYWNRRN